MIKNLDPTFNRWISWWTAAGRGGREKGSPNWCGYIRNLGVDFPYLGYVQPFWRLGLFHSHLFLLHLATNNRYVAFFLVLWPITGFGDVSPESPQYSILTFGVVIVGIALITCCINIAQEKIALLYMRMLEKMLEVFSPLPSSLPYTLPLPYPYLTLTFTLTLPLPLKLLKF